MKDEDIDWLVYHQIPVLGSITAKALLGQCGLEPSVLEDSLARLERYCLIDRDGADVRMLTFGNALIKNQVKYDNDLPFVIENGVIKERKK